MLWHDVAALRWPVIANTLKRWRTQAGLSLSLAELAVAEQTGLTTGTSYTGSSTATISRYERPYALTGEVEPRVARAPLGVLEAMAYTYGHSLAEALAEADAGMRLSVSQRSGLPPRDLEAYAIGQHAAEAELVAAWRLLPPALRAAKLIEMQALVQSRSAGEDRATGPLRAETRRWLSTHPDEANLIRRG